MFRLAYLVIMFNSLVGCRTTDSSVKIFGGDELTTDKAEYEDFLPVVMLKWESYPFSRPDGTCTGTFITDELVLTAAHCLSNSDTGGMKILRGDREIASVKAYHHGVIGYQDVPPVIDAGEGYRDFAILKFPAGSSAGKTMPLCQTRGQVGDDIWMVGYGRESARDRSGITTGIKRYVRETISGIDMDLGHISVERERAGFLEGDSGGPLVSKDNLCIWGVVSYYRTANSYFVDVHDPRGQVILADAGVGSDSTSPEDDDNDDSGSTPDANNLIGKRCTPEEEYSPTLQFRDAQTLRLIGIPPGTDGYVDAPYSLERGILSFIIPYSPDDIDDGDFIDVQIIDSGNQLQSMTDGYPVKWNCR